MHIREELLNKISGGLYFTKEELTEQGFNMEDDKREDGIYGVLRPKSGVFIKRKALNNGVLIAQMVLEIETKEGERRYAMVDGFIDENNNSFASGKKDAILLVSLKADEKINTYIGEKQESGDYLGENFVHELDENNNLKFSKEDNHVKCKEHINLVLQDIESLREFGNKPENSSRAAAELGETQDKPSMKEMGIKIMQLIIKIAEKIISTLDKTEEILTLKFSIKQVVSFLGKLVDSLANLEGKFRSSVSKFFSAREELEPINEEPEPINLNSSKVEEVCDNQRLNMAKHMAQEKESYEYERKLNAEIWENQQAAKKAADEAYFKKVLQENLTSNVAVLSK